MGDATTCTTDSLQSLATALIDDLKDRQPRRVEGITKELHEGAPFLPKERWTKLGDALKEAERPTIVSIPGDKWISLRCDGTGFSKYLPRLRRMEVLEKQGFSNEFANIMQQCCQVLMDKFAGVYGFTQSDEMTVLIKPANVTNGVQQCHPYNGRVQKMCSLAAATVTAHFNYRLMQLCKDDESLPAEALATFDCRVGVYDTKEQALSLILWRGYDSGINGVGDAVHHSKHVNGRKDTMKLSTGEKLQWLLKNNLLPLPRHQREGTFYKRQKREVTATNQATGELVTCLRSRIEHVPGNVICLLTQDESQSQQDVQVQSHPK